MGSAPVVFKIRTRSYIDSEPFGTWRDNQWVKLDGIYEIIYTCENGFMVCHDNLFFKVPFECAVKVTPLEEVMK